MADSTLKFRCVSVRVFVVLHVMSVSERFAAEATFVRLLIIVCRRVFIQLVLCDKNAPDPVEVFSQGKMLGDMTVWACSMVLDVLGWSEDNLVEDLFDGQLGLTKFLSDAESGQLMSF